MRIKLDDKDRRILALLQRNSRLKSSVIARTAKLPRDVVKYRMQRMEKLGVITGYHTGTDPSKMGYPYRTCVLLKSSGMTESQEAALIKYLQKDRYVSDVIRMHGKWAFMIVISARDHRHLDSILNELKSSFDSLIVDIEVLTALDIHKRGWTADLIA